eukprot:745230-Alexandrium_andersonii.AAC.1
MSASLVGSEMCIRDSNRTPLTPTTTPPQPLRPTITPTTTVPNATAQDNARFDYTSKPANT